MNNLQVGQWGEHVAAAWFIKKGYDVYWPKSSANKSVDFIVEKDGETHRVQVKASTYMESGRTNRTPRPSVHVRNKGGFDYLFAIHVCGKARLYPVDALPKAKIVFPLGTGRPITKNIYDVELF